MLLIIVSCTFILPQYWIMEHNFFFTDTSLQYLLHKVDVWTRNKQIAYELQV